MAGRDGRWHEKKRGGDCVRRSLSDQRGSRGAIGLSRWKSRRRRVYEEIWGDLVYGGLPLESVSESNREVCVAHLRQITENHRIGLVLSDHITHTLHMSLPTGVVIIHPRLSQILPRYSCGVCRSASRKRGGGAGDGGPLFTVDRRKCLTTRKKLPRSKTCRVVAK